VTRLAADLRYFTRTSLRGLAGSPTTSAVCVATIAVALVLVGAFGLVVHNMQGLLERLGDDLGVTAYLEPDLDAAARTTLAERVATIEGVAEVAVVSREEALRRFREGIGAQSGLLDALEENPLPASLEITLHEAQRGPEGLRRVVEALDGLPGVADLAFGQEWVEGYARAVRLVRGATIGAGAVLAVAALLIVSNTIRLAVFARRDEVEILALVGASRAFVAWPFLIEGCLQGAAGGVLALVGLYALFRATLPEIESGLSLLLGFAEPAFLTPGSALALVVAGAALGAVGSAAALLSGWRS
jgi:cell division transport system permease protein